jgi:two-component system, cell cycle sensor histidine kinase and response regulator CckA
MIKMPLKPKLRVLVVEDTDEDAALLLRELRLAYEPEAKQLCTAEALRAALAERWDIVISDWSMPRFNGLSAFRIVREVDPDVPFIIVSGTIGEDVAVEALTAGVHDFMTKGKFARLLPAIDRQLREADVRRQQRRSDAELARQRELVAQSEVLHRSMFESSPLPMWTYDRNTLRFITVNDAAIRHYGYSREEFAALTVADIRPLDEVQALRDNVDVATGFSPARLWRHRKKDGSIITVEISANDIHLNGGSARLVLVNDVTERERAREALQRTEEQLRQAQKMEAIGRLAGGVAHDFNNILTVIVSYASMLEDAHDAGDQRRDDVAEIRRAAERANAITRQLLTLSRHSIVAPQSLDLAEVVAGFVPMLRRLVGEQVTLVAPRNKVPPVIADRGQIEQVLMNLVVNARDAMPTGGRLTIETSELILDDEAASVRAMRPGHYALLEITDTGTGMDLETQRRIFDPFFTTKEEGKGTGLGLAIVHGIVSQAGGTVIVYSEPGHGTTFRVKLPVSNETVVAQGHEPIVVPSSLPPITVLVIDDDREVRMVSGRILQAAGCHVIEAATADEARQLCVSHDGSIDVAVVDVALGDGRGDTLIGQLRDLRPSLKFVLMSGYPAGALSASGAAPRDLLAKPFSPSELRAAVGRALGTSNDSGATRVASEADRRPRVLVADDDPMMRKSIARLLAKSDFNAVIVDDGRQAIAALEQGPFDVILSDVQMPECGGLDLVRAVRRIDLDVPVILMSGMPDVETATKALEYGAFRYLTKPLDSVALVKTLHHAARAHALARIRREAYAVTGLHAGASDRAGLEVRFEAGLEQMWMAFQPIVDAKTGGLFGVEALLRSAEPSMPGPQHILDAATQLGRLPQVGRRVRALSSRSLESLGDGVSLFVNLHPEDLADVDLIDERAPLTRLASRVVLEITERASLASSPELSARLARLRKLGFRLAVDDIGAGYSGLTSFTELMPEVVKIDMTLVRDVHRSALKQRTISALCKLCHEVGCVVVGEGVETLEERECLVTLGCDLLQGYLLGHPARELPK